MQQSVAQVTAGCNKQNVIFNNGLLELQPAVMVQFLDAQLYEEAEKRTEEAKNEGRSGGRYRVVGQRGRRKEEGGRRIEWRDDRE